MEIVDKIDYIFTCLPSLHILFYFLRTVIYPSAEVRPGPRQASKVNLFARIVIDIVY